MIRGAPRARRPGLEGWPPNGPPEVADDRPGPGPLEVHDRGASRPRSDFSACLLPSPTPRKGDTHAEPSPLTIRAPVRHRPRGPPGLRPGRARRAARGPGPEEDPQHRGQGARDPRPAHEHPRADPGHQALHVPGAHALRHQGRQGHHRRGPAGPGRELDALAGRHRVDVQAPEGRAVPQGLRRADRRGRQVQLRAADQPGAGHALRRQPRGDQVHRGRGSAHRADRAEVLRRDLPAAHGRLPAGLHRLEEGGREVRRAVQVEPGRHRALLLRAPLPAGEDRPQGLRQVPRGPAPDRRGPLVRRARGRHQADRAREGDVRPALPGGGHRRLREPGREDGRGHRPAGPGPAGALLHQHDQAPLRRHPGATGLHARHRPQGDQGDHVPRHPREAGDQLRAARATSATSR